MTLLVLSYEWLWDGAFRGNGVLVLFLFLAIVVTGHRRRGETLREIGFRLDNFWSSARFRLLVCSACRAGHHFGRVAYRSLPRHDPSVT